MVYMRSILATFVLFVLAQSASAQATSAPATTPVVALNQTTIAVVLEGEINEFTEASVIRRINEAKALGASTVLLRLNTNGGMVGSALEISRFIKQQDSVHIIAYVEQKAYSAGA